MNNKIAIELKGIAADALHDGLFDSGSGRELLAAIKESIDHMEEMSVIHHRFITNARRHESQLDSSRQERLGVEALLDKERQKNKRLTSLLNVANHKCSAYKSILKDAIKGEQ